MDEALPLIQRRGKQVQDVVGYLEWLHDRNRKYMDNEAVFEFLVKKTDLSCSSDNVGPKKEPRGPDGKNSAKKAVAPLKGRTRGAIIGFWGRGEAGHFAHLNTAITVTLRAIYFEGLSQGEAMDLVNKYVDDLPNPELSSRLANNRSAIDGVIRRDANKIWDDNGGQVDNPRSSEKWRIIIQRWRLIGFLVSDKPPGPKKPASVRSWTAKRSSSPRRNAAC